MRVLLQVVAALLIDGAAFSPRLVFVCYGLVRSQTKRVITIMTLAGQTHI